MSATNTTTNLGLSQFVNTDVPAWRQDYNGDMLKIDNAYTADISGATAETSADPSDYMKFYDVSATTNKKILISDLLKGAKVEDLTDTDITTPVDNDGLVYDATAQKWENKPVVTGDLWVQNGAHNLLPFDKAYIKSVNTGGTWAGDVYTRNEATFTLNADGTVTCDTNGQTLSANTSMSIVDVGSFRKSNVVLKGCPSGGGADTYSLAAYDNGAWVSPADTGNGYTSVGEIRAVAITLKAGQVIDNLTFKAMLVDPSDTDDTFASYAMTNWELTPQVLYNQNNIYICKQGKIVIAQFYGATPSNIASLNFANMGAKPVTTVSAFQCRCDAKPTTVEISSTGTVTSIAYYASYGSSFTELKSDTTKAVYGSICFIAE